MSGGVAPAFSSGAIEIEICVFAQEGLISYPCTDELLVEALRRGAKLIGLGHKKDKAIRVWDLRLIRQHLKTLGLDWDSPDYPPADDQSNAAKPPQVKVLFGAPAITPTLTPEQRAIQAIEKYFRAVKDALPLDGKK